MKSLFYKLIGVAIFVYLLGWIVDIGTLGARVGSLRFSVLALVIPFHLAQWTLRVLRWQMLLRNESIPISFWENFAVATSGFFFGSLTPGRLGEFAKVKFLMNAGASFRGAFMSSFLERVMDIFALLFYVAAGILVCRDLMPEQAYYYFAMALFLLAAPLGMYIYRKALLTLAMRMIPEKIAVDVEEKIHVCTRSFRNISPNQWAAMALYSLAIWGLNYWMIFLLFRGTGYSLSLYYAFAFAAFGSLAGLLPISIYGVGVREAILMAFFSRAHYPDAVNAAVVFGLMFLVLLIYHIVLGFIGWMSPAMKRFLTRPV
ncbi:MAG: lysylphosphatidylglycerol synthase transmembrane domain-containing protein [Candidatus Omnitrophota bacterium]